MWGETGEPGENPQRNGENMQIHRKKKLLNQQLIHSVRMQSSHIREKMGSGQLGEMNGGWEVRVGKGREREEGGHFKNSI